MNLLSGIMVFVSLLVFALNTGAGSLREDYRKSVIRRQQIEKIRSRYETDLRTLSSERHKLNLVLYKCVSKNRGDGWESRLEEEGETRDLLEAERFKLVGLRKDLDNERRKFEEMRVAIEGKYKGKRRGKEYEAEFREYMELMDEKYFTRVETELFNGYETYLSGVKNYLEFLKKSVAECRENAKKEQ